MIRSFGRLGASLGRALALGLIVLAASAAQAAPDFPRLTGRVVDAADILPAPAEAQLTDRLARLETQSRRQFVVATVPSLQGLEIADYGYQLGRSWGIGQKGGLKPGAEHDNGVLLIVAPNEREVRIEVGYGLEPVLTDALSSVILQTQVLPKFKAGDLSGGVVAGADAIVQQLTLPEDQAFAVAQQASARVRPADNAGGGSWLLLLLLIVLIFYFIRRRRAGPWIAGGSGDRWTSGGGGSGWSGGSSWGGGGFSGGGGSFGGGGASGRW